jgi:hypothetical protein
VTVRGARALAAGALLLLAGACGRKGSPLPPLPFAPARVADPQIHRIADRVELRFTIPAANADGTTPSLLDRVEIYAMPTSAGAPPPTVNQILAAANLKGRVQILDEREPPPAGQSETRPAPGELATFVDRAGTDQQGLDAPVLHYVLVGVAGRSRRGPTSGPFAVPLANAPVAPAGFTLTYDEERLILTWQPTARDGRYRVYEATAAGTDNERPPLSALLDAPTFSEPVTFGAQRCLAVRAAQQAGPVLIEGPASPPQCVTPADTFPPPAPSALVAFAAQGAVELAWDPVTAKDLAGYVVLRGEGSGEKLLRLTKPMTDLHYTDREVTRGTTYWYAVAAEDGRGNVSPPSARQSATVRNP